MIEKHMPLCYADNKEVIELFRNKTNEEIGAYISRLIEENFKSISDFCRAYLKLQNQGSDYSEEDFKNIKNRISQIKNGKKSIQVYDLQFFCELFGVSCEQILSGGDCFVPNSNRITNYDIAQSKDKEVWKRYIQREDKLIMNADEYCKTVLDYALEFGNYDFLKYLMNEGYIWFVDSDRKNYWFGFGAGTSIERRHVGYIDDLDSRMKQQDYLRRKMISLAIDRKDFTMLNKLKAREIPPFYHYTFYGMNMTDCESFYDKNMVAHIADANQKIITYFTEEFQIENDWKELNTFMFPYINELLHLLIKSDNEYLYTILKRCVEHNRNAFNVINETRKNILGYYTDLLKYRNDESLINQSVDRELSQNMFYYKDGNIISVMRRFSKTGMVTNLVNIKAKSKNKEIAQLIDEVNEYFYKILALKDAI